MSGKLPPFPGDRKVAVNKLASAKARDLAEAVSDLPYVKLVECRTGTSPEADYLIVDLEVELPQYPVVDIRKHELCAIVFPTDSTTTFIDVLALREDFPQVPHLNLREQEYPKSLCVYEDPFSEYGLKWSPV